MSVLVWETGPEEPWRILVFKLGSVVVIVGISVLCSLLPLKLRHLSDRTRSLIVDLSNYFTAGVFLGVGLLHMLPEAAEKLDAHHSHLAHGICALGIVIIWFLERHMLRDSQRIMVVAAGAEQRGGGSICYVHVNPVSSYGMDGIREIGPGEKSSERSSSLCALPGSIHRSVSEPLLKENKLNNVMEDEALRKLVNNSYGGEYDPLEGKHTSSGGSLRIVQNSGLSVADDVAHCDWDPLEGEHTPGGDGVKIVQNSGLSVADDVAHCDDGSRSEDPSCTSVIIPVCSQSKCERSGSLPASFPLPRMSCGLHDHYLHSKEWVKETEGAVAALAPRLTEVAPDAVNMYSTLHEHSHSAHHHHVVLDGEGRMSYVLALLFSFHSFVVGVAFGSGGAISLLIALLAHKGTEAFAVGVQFVREAVPLRKAVPVILLYCTMTPMGIFAGMAETVVKGTAGIIVVNVTQAVGAGTVLYIALIQLVGTSNSAHEQNRWFQLSLVVLGLGIMAAVSIFV